MTDCRRESCAVGSPGAHDDSPLADHLYSALSLTERVTYLRRATAGWVRSRVNGARAAAALERWKAQQPSPQDAFFAERLRLDSLTERDLLAILSLPPAVYSELITAPPDWVVDLERLFVAGCSFDADPAFSRYAQDETKRFLWIIAPLVREGLRRFREGIGRLELTSAPFDPPAAEGLVLPHLLRTLQGALDLVMVLELNVARVRGELTGDTAQQRFDSFCERLRRTDVRTSIAREYPVLFRSLHFKTVSWADSSLELLERLSSDWDLIRARLAVGAEPGRLTSIRVGAGDVHRGGRTVAVLEFSSGLELVYKPHSLSADVHFGELLGWINRCGFETPFRVLDVIDRGRYGWSEFVAHAPCSERAEVERFYRRLGGYLAVFHVLRARDMHSENLIAASEFPVPVDLETLFHGDPPVVWRDDPAFDAFHSSVMQVMLLPTPVDASDTGEVVDMSAFGARSGQPFPLGAALRWEGAGTDEMRLVRSTELPRMAARSRPVLDGTEVAAGEYVGAFLAGFRRVYRLIAEGRDELLATGGILDRFGGDEVRFVARATATYALLLRCCHQPDLQRDALERDHLLETLWLATAHQPQLTRLVSAEMRDLQRGDVPLFTSRADSRDLWASEGERITEVFERSAMALVREGLRGLGEEDLARQEALIVTAIVASGDGAAQVEGLLRKPNLTGRTEAIDLARAVGDMLCRDALETDGCASWIGITPVGAAGRSSVHPLDVTLYEGLPGCSLFLAYLGALAGDESYQRVARKAVTLLRRHLQRGRAGSAPVSKLGAFSGLGGIVYALAHLAVLWNDASLIDEAEALARDVPLLIGADEALDVVGGAAGAIAALEVLNRVRPGEQQLDAALLCGERLLLKQQPRDRGAGWATDVEATQPLTGFSHGAAGIAWALLKLAAWSGETRFREAAESAIAYERSTFVAEEGNWPDYRVWPGRDPAHPRFEVAWCHGAPGIGLARIDSLHHMDDRDTREEIRVALRKTVQAELRKNHCLCHGELGNLDVLLHAGQRVEESWWSEAGERRARETLAGIAHRGFVCSSALPPPGLMVGLSGIGYGLLRLAYPERVPSVLVLAPPPGM
jgi:type 2 lantibiotic biosynthesis protein LanM